METTTFTTGYQLFSRSSSLSTLWFGNSFQINIVLNGHPWRNRWYYTYGELHWRRFFLNKYSF